MALISRQVHVLFPSTSVLTTASFYFPHFFVSPHLGQVVSENFVHRFGAHLNKLPVLKLHVIDDAFVLFTSLEVERLESPMTFVPDEHCPRRFRLHRQRRERPLDSSSVVNDFTLSSRMLDLTRQFHNKNRTKTTILTKDHSDRVEFPFAFASRRRGKEIVRSSHRGDRYTLRVTPLPRKRALRLKPHIPNKVVAAKKKILIRSRVKTAPGRIEVKKGPAFSPKKKFLLENTDIAEPPQELPTLKVPVLHSVPNATFENGKPYVFSDGRIRVTQGKMGLHLNLAATSEKAIDVVRDYLFQYSPARDDFIVSFSSRQRRFHIFPCSKSKVLITDANDARVVETVHASAEYIEYSRCKLRSSFPDTLVNRFRAARGYCYLNHVWFLCLRAGISFRAAFDYFWNLGKNPTATALSQYVTNYFGAAASHYHIAGWYTGKNKFHCDNSSRRMYTLQYLRSALVGANGKPDEESELIPLSDAQRLKVLNQVHDNIRASRDSMLVKNLEVDLVDYFNSTKDIQREKQKVLVPFLLTETQQGKLLQAYPQFNIVFSNSSFSDHPMAASSRLLENCTLADFCGSHFADVGGSPLHHYHASKTKRVHVCCPVLDAKDAQRRVLRNLQLQLAIKRPLTDAALHDNATVPSSHTSCNKSIIDCSYKSDFMIMVQVYDVELEVLCRSMIKRGASVCYVTMITPGELLDRREAFHHDTLNCDITINSHANSIAYKFGSSCYTHSFTTILTYMTTPVVVIDNNLFSIEMVSERCGVNYYQVTRSSVCPAMSCTKVLRYRRCCEGLVRVKLPRFCKKTRKCLPGIDYIYVDTDFVERIYQYVIGNCGVVNSKTFEWTWNYVKSSKSRVIISGKMIHRDVSISVEDMESFVVVMLAAGVRSRLASEYLAKNVSLYAGDASLTEIISFSIREKVSDFKRGFYNRMSKLLKDLFSDVLLMQFLDLDDALTYFDPYSEVSVQIHEQGFGSIASDETDKLIAQKCASDITATIAAKAVAVPYVPPSARSDARGKPAAGGLRGGGKGRSYLNRLNGILELIAQICPSFLSQAFSKLAIFLKVSCEAGGKIERKFFTLYQAVLSLGRTFLWGVREIKDALLLSFRISVSNVASFSKSFVALVRRHLSAPHVTGRWVLDVLSSYSEALSAGATSATAYLFKNFSDYASIVKNFSFFEFEEHIPFEIAVSIVERFVLDVPSVCKGEMSLSDLLFRCVYNVVLELNICAMTSVVTGPSDTIKKDMFVRAFASIVAGRVFSPFSFTPLSVLRLSALLPMLLRKLLVCFFDDEYNTYVGVVKYGVDELGDYRYIKLKYDEYVATSVSSISERFRLYVGLFIDSAVDEVAARLSERLSANSLVKRGKTAFSVLNSGFEAVKRGVSTFYQNDDESTEYYSDESDDELFFAARPGLFGGSTNGFLRLRAFGTCRAYLKNFFESIKDFFSLGSFFTVPVFTRFSGMACDLLSSYGSYLYEQYEDYTFLLSAPVTLSVDGLTCELSLVRHRRESAAPEQVTSQGSLYTALWYAARFADFLRHHFSSRNNVLKAVPYVLVGITYSYYYPVPAFFSLLSYLLKFLFFDRFTIVVTVLAPVGDNSGETHGIVEIGSDDGLPENFNDSSETPDCLFKDIPSYDSLRPGLLGGGCRTSLLKAFLKLVLRTYKFLFLGSFSKLFRVFFVGSLLNSLFRSKWASKRSKLLGLLIALMMPRSVLVPVSFYWCDLSNRKTGLRIVLSKLKFLSKSFEKLFLAPKISFASFTNHAPAYAEVRTHKSLKVDDCKDNRSLLDSFIEIDNLKRIVKSAVKEVKSAGSGGNAYDDCYYIEDEGQVNEGELECETVQCDKSLSFAAQADDNGDHPNTDKLQLLPIVSRIVSSDASVETSSVAQKPGRNNGGLCKYLQSLNLHVTAPRPYIPAPKGDGFPLCSNAIREFYFLNEVALFSLYTKLFSYFEQLKSSGFDRTLCECDMDEDLFVFDSRKNRFVPKKGVYIPKDLKSHEMMFTSEGMVLNDSKSFKDKLLHLSTSFVAANSFLLACESHSSINFTNTDVKIILYEAPPGGGKTTALIDLLFESSKSLDCLVVTANKNSQIDIKLKVSKRFGKEKPGTYRDDLSKRILTLDSYLMNHFGRKCSVLFVDECFMVHSGQVLAAINATRCNRCVMFGDSRQIHYIQRNEITSSFYGDLDAFVAPEARVYGNVSYRCPWDVCEWLTRVYKNKITTNNFESVGRSSVTLCQIEGMDAVPVLSGVKYVTYTQGEKNELQRYVSKKMPKSVVNTVHEVQGETFDRVALVRTKYQEDAPFVSENHIIVALSRHVESLHYYVLSSRCYDDTSRAIRDMIEVSEKYKMLPKSFTGSDIETVVSGEPVDNTSCKALSAPVQVLNEFLEEIVPGSTTINFGDPSADMSSSPFECGVDGVVIREADNGGRYSDHDPARV
nr:P1a polyprotein [Carrot closterovirus 2]